MYDYEWTFQRGIIVSGNRDKPTRWVGYGWVSALIVNDDNLGPYKMMPRDDTDFGALAENCQDLLPPNWSWNSTDDIHAIIVPLTEEVAIQARHIDWLVKEQVLNPDSENSVLARFLSEATPENENLEYFLASALGHVPDERVITRAYLARSMEFLGNIRRIRDTYPDEYPLPIQAYYDQQQYPTYIWVVELSLQSEVQSKPVDQRLINGEIIFDATANKYDPCWLFVHINGWIVKRILDTEEAQFSNIGNIPPYRSCKSV